jgi:hypothetical protein
MSVKDKFGKILLASGFAAETLAGVKHHQDISDIQEKGRMVEDIRQFDRELSMDPANSARIASHNAGFQEAMKTLEAAQARAAQDPVTHELPLGGFLAIGSGLAMLKVGKKGQSK